MLAIFSCIQASFYSQIKKKSFASDRRRKWDKKKNTDKWKTHPSRQRVVNYDG